MSVRDHVVTTPTQETQRTIQDYLSSAPFDTAPPEQWHVTVNVLKSSIDEGQINPQAKFLAVPQTAKLWHDDATGRLSLVIVLESEDLRKRYSELSAQFGSQYEVYVPHLTVIYGFSSLTRANKSFLSSLASSMNRVGQSEGPFQFEGELLVDSHGYAPNAEGQKYYAGF